jgi:flagellar motor switch/type III secretory pathway protein FliN
VSSVPTSLRLAKLPGQTAVELALCNRLVAQGPIRHDRWSLFFQHGKFSRPQFLVFLQHDATQVGITCELEIDGKSVAKFADICGDDSVIEFVRAGLSDLFVQCTKITLGKIARASTSPSYTKNYHFLVRSERDGVSISLTIPPHILKLLEPLVRHHLARSQTKKAAQWLREISVAATVKHIWSDVSLQDLALWDVGDFLPITPTNAFATNGISVALVDFQSTPIAEANLFVRELKIVAITANRSAPRNKKLASNVANLDAPLKEENMPDASQNKQPAPEAGANQAAALSSQTKSVDHKITIPIYLNFGEIRLSIAELQALGPGQVIDFSTSASDEVSVFAGDQRIALGALCEINGSYGVVIRKMMWASAPNEEL